MTVQFYPNGVGGSAPGDSLDLVRPLQTTGNIWYVSSAAGFDAASPAGQNREKPLSTLAQAITNAADDDIIVFLPGHTQTLTATQNIAKRVVLMGEGVTAGKPSVSFKMNAAATVMFNITSSQVELRNLYLPPNLQNNNQARIVAGGSEFLMRGCYIECGSTDLAAALTLGSLRPRIESSVFISTTISAAGQPLCAVNASFNPISGCVMQDVVFSAGQYGFSNYAAVDLSAASFSLQMRWENVSLLLGADVLLSAATTGRINIQTATGGSRVQWA